MLKCTIRYDSTVLYFATMSIHSKHHSSDLQYELKYIKLFKGFKLDYRRKIIYITYKIQYWLRPNDYTIINVAYSELSCV